MIEIPRIIHFIWAGGEKTLPDENTLAILKWHIANPSFDVWIWIDQCSYSGTSLSQLYREAFENCRADNFPNAGINLDCFKFKDIEEEGVSHQLVRYEIDRLRPNYGASSDILRYAILYRFGGLYLDSDIDPGTQTLEESGIFIAEEGHRLYVDEVSQLDSKVDMITIRDMIEANTIAAANGNVNSAVAPGSFIGNDLLISTPENPLMQKIFKVATHNYYAEGQYTVDLGVNGMQATIAFPESNLPASQAYQYDTAKFINELTPKKTGPVCVRDITVQLLRREFNGARLVRPVDVAFRKPVRENGLAWIDKKLMPFDDITEEQYFRKITKSISIEVDIGFLRLEDHVSNLLQITTFSRAQAINGLLNVIRDTQIDYRKLRAIQNTGRFPELLQFYRECDFSPALFHTNLTFNFAPRYIHVLPDTLGGIPSPELQEEVTRREGYHLWVQRKHSFGIFKRDPQYVIGFVNRGRYTTQVLLNNNGLVAYLDNKQEYRHPQIISEEPYHQEFFSLMGKTIAAYRGLKLATRPSISNVRSAIEGILQLPNIRRFVELGNPSINLAELVAIMIQATAKILEILGTCHTVLQHIQLPLTPLQKTYGLAYLDAIKDTLRDGVEYINKALIVHTEREIKSDIDAAQQLSNEIKNIIDSRFKPLAASLNQAGQRALGHIPTT